jgi:endonuclease-3
MAEKTQAQAAAMAQILRAAYKDVKPGLVFANTYQLLIATILSAQSTDRQVNRVTPALFKAYPYARCLAEASAESLQTLLQSLGLFRAKASYIRECARLLVARHHGRVPGRRSQLTALPGVGRKTANVVLALGFGQPAIIVDTHVIRLSRRLGLSDGANPAQIEKDLQTLLPQSQWNGFCARLIRLGREICTARKPLCPQCPLNAACPYPHKTL